MLHLRCCATVNSQLFANDLAYAHRQEQLGTELQARLSEGAGSKPEHQAPTLQPGARPHPFRHNSEATGSAKRLQQALREQRRRAEPLRGRKWQLRWQLPRRIRTGDGAPPLDTILALATPRPELREAGHGEHAGPCLKVLRRPACCGYETLCDAVMPAWQFAACRPRGSTAPPMDVAPCVDVRRHALGSLPLRQWLRSFGARETHLRWAILVEVQVRPQVLQCAVPLQSAARQ